MGVGFQNQFLENAGRSPQIPDKKVGRRSYPWPEKELGGGKELDFIRDQRDCWRRVAKEKKNEGERRRVLYLASWGGIVIPGRYGYLCTTRVFWSRWWD